MSNALPRQVKEQIDAANKIIDQMRASENSEEVPPEKEAEPPKQEVEEKPQEAAPEKAPDPEHKYNVLKGKYNKEVPRLQQQLRDASSENSELRQRLNDLEATMKSLRAIKEEEKKQSSLPNISDEEREQFGDDLIDLMERVARRATLPEIEAHLKPLEGRVKQVDEKVAHSEQTVAESRRRETIQALANAVPNWVEQNEDPEFLSWLEEIEPSVGVPRSRLLTDAFRANDAQRVIWFFKGFHSENAADTSSAAPPKKAEPQQKLDDYVAPGTPKTGTASAPNESGKRVWTRRDIQAFYAEKNKYIHKGKKVPDELVKLERDLFKAQTEGRLR